MPYPNYHSARLTNPQDCGKDSFSTIRITEGINLILCKKDGKRISQAYRFQKDKYTPEEARAWLKKHKINYITFESGDDNTQIGAKLSLKAWNGSAANYSLEEWKRACALKICDDETKNCYKLPCKTPSGELDPDGVKAAYGALMGARNKPKATPEQLAAAKSKIEGYYKKLGLKHTNTMKATNSEPEVNSANGRIWSKGIHHVYVNDKPSTIYVPESTVMDTFKSIKTKINDDGRVPLGIDHLNERTFNNNDILRKMNLLDVGDIRKVGTDGESIYILESEIQNTNIQELQRNGELPAYSIVGEMSADPCTTNKADYVVRSIDVERVDFVEEGGCQVCTVGAEPETLILTSKKVEDDIMVDENETQENKVEETKETVSNETNNDVVEQPQEVDEQEPEPETVTIEDESQEPTTKDEDMVTVEDKKEEVDDKSYEDLLKEVTTLKEQVKELGGKKPSTLEDFDAVSAVNKLINEGRVLPKMKDGLVMMAKSNPEAFNEYSKTLPKMVVMETRAKLARTKKQEKQKAEQEQADEDMKWMAKQYFKVDLD